MAALEHIDWMYSTGISVPLSKVLLLLQGAQYLSAIGQIHSEQALSSQDWMSFQI